jgi:adenylate cyclase
MPIVAVLPFSNLSAEAEQGYFADGVVEDIITALSRFKSLAVVSRNASFVFRDKAFDVRDAAKALGVRYVLEGSVRRSGKRLRVTAQLTDAEAGTQLWGERFEGADADIFDFQDRITESVVGLVEPEIRRAEIERARRKRPENLDAYDLFLKALPMVYGMNPDGYAQAILLLDRAMVLDPGFGLAIAYAAWTYEKRLTLDLPPIGIDDAERCLGLARAALAVGRDDPLVSVISGFVLYAKGHELAGLEMVRQAVAASPNNLVVLNLGGIANTIAFDLDAASACFLRAVRLSPGAPDAYWSLTGEGWVQLERGNFEAALEWSRRSLATSNEWPMTYYTIAAANALLGRMDEARAAIGKLRALAPQVTLRTSTFQPGTVWKHMTDGLRLAGLPER